MKAAFHRSGAHKLPGKMGELREDAVCVFLNEWLPRRFRALTNVLPVHKGNHELNRELDLVVLDELEGFRLPLDPEGSVSLVAWDDISLHCEVKSVLSQSEYEQACAAASACKDFAHETGTNSPLSILFAFDAKANWAVNYLENDVLTGCTNTPFDAIFILGRGAYYSGRMLRLSQQVLRGLSLEMRDSDGSAATEEIISDITHSAETPPFQTIADGSDADTLFALMAFVAHAVDGDNEKRVSDELIMAARRATYHPVHALVPAAEAWEIVAVTRWADLKEDKEAVTKLKKIRKYHQRDWARLLCMRFGLEVLEHEETTTLPFGGYIAVPLANGLAAALPGLPNIQPGTSRVEAIKFAVSALKLDELAVADFDGAL